MQRLSPVRPAATALALAMILVLVLAGGCAPVSKTPNPASASAALAAAAPSPTNSHTILLMPREVGNDLDLMIDKEVGAMVPMLKDAGYDVVIATASGKPVKGITETLPADMALANVNDYAGYVIPCMSAGDSAVIPPEFIPVVQKAMATGRPMAIQQSAAQILYTAGLLKGRKYASQAELPDGTNMGNVVVQDGNLISSGVCPYMTANAGLPDGTTELMEKFVAALKGKS